MVLGELQTGSDWNFELEPLHPVGGDPYGPLAADPKNSQLPTPTRRGHSIGPGGSMPPFGGMRQVGLVRTRT